MTLSFEQYLIESKNTHMEHLEDLVLNKGIIGARETFWFLSSLGRMLEGDIKTKVKATVKWDGAPAIFMGIDPKDKQFFIAKKGLFNINPKFYKTHDEIDRDLSGELADKFHIALNEFPKLGLQSGIVQGDLMFTSNDIQVETIEGNKYYTFHPNTIVYAVPTNSPLGQRIKNAKIGVIWHTTYTGRSIKSMKASFAKGIVNRLNHVSSVWMDDATYKDVSGQATMTANETKVFRQILAQAGRTLHQINSSHLNAISANEELVMSIKAYNNLKIRGGEHISNTRAHARGLVNYILQKYKKEEMSRKTAQGKAKVRAKKNEIIKPLVAMNPTQLAIIFDFMNLIVDAKHIIVNKMNKAQTIGTFLRTASGFRVTTPEGFCAIDHLNTGAVKLVDRLEFSHANFSADIMKGWQR